MDSVYDFRGIRVIFLTALFFFISLTTKAQLWSEDFIGEANGATTGTAGGTLGGSWSTSYSGSGTFSRQDVTAVDEVFHASGTTSEGIWSTNTINISSVGYAIVNMDVYSAFVGSDDYIRIAYVLDGVEVTFYELIGGNGFAGLSVEAPASAIVAGNSLQLKVYSRNDPGFIPFFNGQYAFDNVTITAAPIIYSRTSGSWTNAVAGTGTWSLTGHTGASCACYPLNTQVAIIGAGHTVTLQSSQTTIGTPPTINLAPGAVDVYGTLQYSTNNNVTLGIQQGLFRVRNGGVVNSNPGTLTGETISFQANVGGATLSVDAGGSVSIEDLSLAAAATNFHYLTGSGSLSITDDILMGATGATLTNNRTAAFTVSDVLDFNAESGFVNNGTMTITNDILFDANNSSFTNNSGGSLTLGDDLDFNATSSFVNNGVTIVTDDITVDADDASITNNTGASLSITSDLSFTATNSTFSNSGTTSITGNLTATANTDDGNETTNNSGGILTLAGVNPNSADMNIFNSGTINQSGNFSNISATSNFDNLSTGVWNWSLTPNTTFDTDMATAMNNTAIGNTFNYNGAGAQRIIPTTYHHILLSNSGAKEANNASFSVQGDWTVSGSATFTEGTGTITLNGSVAQTITNPSGETFNNLTINNSLGTSPQIILRNAVTVTATLTMSDGNVDLDGNSFTIGSSAAAPGVLSHAGASTNGWMYEGNLIRYMATAATTIGTGDQNEGFFPLGSASDWRPFFIGKSNTASSGGRITVSHTNSTSTSDVTIPDTNPVATIRRRHNSFWTVATSGISAGTWALRAGGTNFGTIANASHLRMSTSSGVVGTNAAGSGGPDWRVNRTALTFGQLANNFHVASTDATNSPLPIELLSFSAQLKNNSVDLKWSTASETNNDYFTVERATDVEHFDPILTHDGQGTSKELNHYELVDFAPLYGRSYYRLKQTDFDGKFTYSELRTVDYNGPEFATLTAFPNPLTEPTLNIKIEGLKAAGDVLLQILNLHGQKVFEKVIEIKTPGIITEEISRTTFPSSGLYIIKAGETLYMTKKIVIE